MWNLSSYTLLTTFQFPKPISLLTWDPTERVFFAGSADGDIHQVNLFKRRQDKLSRVLEAVGGAGSTDIVRPTEEDEDSLKKRLIPVGCVQTSCITSGSQLKYITDNPLRPSAYLLPLACC